VGFGDGLGDRQAQPTATGGAIAGGIGAIKPFENVGQMFGGNSGSVIGTKLATPSLRNIALTAPYMHDGRFATLEEVVDHYCDTVKRSATLDPNLAKHPDGGIGLEAADRRALVAFLRTLTDARWRP
jgi:hypothetical protein